jgi:hypothetical protein
MELVPKRRSVLLACAAVTLAFGVFTTGGGAESLRAQACMEGVDTVKSSISAEVYCGPASAVVMTKGASTKSIKPGTCVKGLRGLGSFDLYLGRDESGAGPWARHLHLSKPGAGLKPGLYMEDRFTQWAGLSTLKLTFVGKGGSFSGTAPRRTKGKTADPRAPIKGTFTCKG